MEALLSMQSITKTYPGVTALDRVSFMLKPGEVHCLVGENGAGKSTLMKILGGAITMDSGTIEIAGSAVIAASPAKAQHLGIGIIYQDFKLVNDLSVAENVLLGQEPLRGWRMIDTKLMHEKVRRVLEQLGEELDTRARVGALSVAKRQIVEIAKTLVRDVRILVMDEPSASLTDQEIQNMFQVIRRLKAEGVGVIYISHRLDEIFEIGERVTVLRDGKHVTTAPVGEVDRRTLIRWMVGRELEQEYPKIPLKGGTEILRVEHLGAGRLQDINFSVIRGEIFGIAGLVGAGRSELAHVIFGADPREEGGVYLDNQEFNPSSPREAIEAGVGLLTEDRNRYGLLTQMNVRENISLSRIRDLLRGFRIDKKKEQNAVQGFVDQLKIKTSSTEVGVDTLSGGNRQKVVLARWLFTQSRLLIFDEPTAGIDVGAKFEIYNLMNDLAERGIGIIIISSELPELLGMCDRIAVMCDGRINGILTREEFTQEKILALATQFDEETVSVH